jgi:hypothetical protein
MARKRRLHAFTTNDFQSLSRSEIIPRVDDRGAQ